MDISTETSTILETGTISIKGEFLWGSNYTFLTQIERGDQTVQAVYKPSRGERPLWDFPAASLARREAAAYLVSELLGWGLVPPTVYRTKAPLGAGSLQIFVDHEPEYHYFNFSSVDRNRLRPVVIFDLLINNADRKGSHILKDAEGKLWLIDHGLCFHVEDKLRTVIWDFIGEPIPDLLCRDLSEFSRKLQESKSNSNGITAKLWKYLSRGEIQALIERAEGLTEGGFFPAPDPYRRPFPWPQV